MLDDLHRVALRLTRSTADAEELVAETVVRACENYSALRDLGRAKQWMLRILSNAFISSCRARKRHHEVPYTEISEDDEQPFSLFDELIDHAPPAGNPEREVIAKLMDEDIQRAIASLPEEFRVVIVLCDVEGYSYEEIANMIEIPLGTVRSRLSRGRSLLQKQLYHYAQEQGWLTPKNESTKGKTEGELCECERTKLPASVGAGR